MPWNEKMEKIEEFRSEMERFYVEFVDDVGFREFVASLGRPSGEKPRRFRRFSGMPGFDGKTKFLYITGYFGEGISDFLCKIAETDCVVKLISPGLTPQRRPDELNLIALRKMQDEGIEIKINKRMHARLFIAFNTRESFDEPQSRCFLLLGTFDFNREGIGGEKRNAGIITSNPDLVKSAVEFFEKTWMDGHETTSLDEEYPS